MDPEPEELVLFHMRRDKDVSGISGTGIVAYGIRFPEPNGRAVLGWVPDENHTSVAVYDSLDDLRRIHSHNGATEIVPIDVIDCGGP